MRLTFREMRGRATNMLGQQQDGVIEPKEVEDALNDVYLELCKEFGMYRSSYTAAAVSGSRSYAPPTDLVELERVDFDERQLGLILIDEISKFGDDVTIETPAWTEDV